MYHSERFENLRTSSHCPNTESSPPVSLLRDVSLNSSWRLASNSYASSSLLLEKHSQFQIWLFFTLICKQPFPYFTAVLHYKKSCCFFFSPPYYPIFWTENSTVFHIRSHYLLHRWGLLLHFYGQSMVDAWLPWSIDSFWDGLSQYTRLSTSCTAVPNGTLFFPSQ